MPPESPRNSPPQTHALTARSTHESPAPQLLFPSPSLPSTAPSYPVPPPVSPFRTSFESPRFARSSRANFPRPPFLLRAPPPHPPNFVLPRHSLLPAPPPPRLSNPQMSLQSADTSAGSCSPLLPHPDRATVDRAAPRRRETAPASPARALPQPLLPSAPPGSLPASPFAGETPHRRSRSKFVPCFPKRSIAPSPPSSSPKLSRRTICFARRSRQTVPLRSAVFTYAFAGPMMSGWKD